MHEENTKEYFFQQEKGLSRERPTACDHTSDHQIRFDDDVTMTIKECIPQDDPVEKKEEPL